MNQEINSKFQRIFLVFLNKWIIFTYCEKENNFIVKYVLFWIDHLFEEKQEINSCIFTLSQLKLNDRFHFSRFDDVIIHIYE